MPLDKAEVVHSASKISDSLQSDHLWPCGRRNLDCTVEGILSMYGLSRSHKMRIRRQPLSPFLPVHGALSRATSSTSKGGSFAMPKFRARIGGPGVGLSVMALAWLGKSVEAQGTSVNCLPGNEFVSFSICRNTVSFSSSEIFQLNNNLNQTPCMLFAILSSGCNNSGAWYFIPLKFQFSC